MSTGRTTIIVTRRLSSIKMVNKIIVLNKGRVEEEGSHTQLMDKHGTYFNLYTKQQKFFKSSEKDLTLDSISEIPEAYEGSEDTEKVVGGATAGIMDPATGSDLLVSPADVIREIADDKPETVRWSILCLLASDCIHVGIVLLMIQRLPVAAAAGPLPPRPPLHPVRAGGLRGHGRPRAGAGPHGRQPRLLRRGREGRGPSLRWRPLLARGPLHSHRHCVRPRDVPSGIYILHLLSTHCVRVKWSLVIS